MKNILTYLFLISCCLTGWKASAQDPHYTQAHRIPSWYNPATAGHGVEHIRLTMLYRNQWSSVMSPFKTQGLFFDKQVSKVGLGANLVNNSSGDAGIRQLFLNGQISYRYSIGKSVIASGLQVGLIQKSFDPSKMTFDDQYTPDQGANPTNPTSETFSYTKLTRPDFGTGLLWTYGRPGKEKFYPYAGISLQHINQPKESFIEENNIIPRKLTANAGVGIVLSEAITITPMLLFAQQQFSKELIGGVMVKLPLDGRDNVEGGLLYRNKDAAALYAGYQWNNFMLGMSYDVNLSGVTGGPGAFELTLTYIPKAKAKKELAKKKEIEKKTTSKPKSPTSEIEGSNFWT
ncbi:MAG: PorP/SprF family type IX secretion system membrane protein [Bacteroidetes bacterium]|nr:PorP/SprF family type IX secretion system membrane protein [Bacteroidota bacterium]